MAPWRSTPGSMLSAPAAIPATREQTFNEALAPLSIGALSQVSASRARPARRAIPLTASRWRNGTLDKSIFAGRKRILALPTPGRCRR